jgi:hypothetical protein
MRRSWIPWLLLLGCQAPLLPPEGRKLGTLPEGVQARSFCFSRDGRVAAYVLIGAPEQDRVVVKGVAGKPLSLIC